MESKLKQAEEDIVCAEGKTANISKKLNGKVEELERERAALRVMYENKIKEIRSMSEKTST